MVRHISDLALQYSVRVRDLPKIVLMSSLKKLGNFLGLTDDLESSEVSQEVESPRIRVREGRSFASVQPTPTATAVEAPASNQIFTVCPSRYRSPIKRASLYERGFTVKI